MRATTLLLVGLMACGDDSTAADAGNDSATDATVAPDTATVDAGVDTATEDAGDTDATDSGADTDDTPVDLLTSLTDGMELLFDTDFDSLTAGALVESEAEDVLFDYRFGAERTTVVDTPHGQGLRFLFEAGQCCYWEGFRALRTLPRVVRGTMVHHFRFRFVPGFDRNRGGKIGPSNNFDTEGDGIREPEYGGYVAYMWRRPGLRPGEHCGPAETAPSTYEPGDDPPAEEIELHAYVNHKNMIGDFSDECFFHDEEGTRLIYSVDTWISVITRIEVNTPGETDGRIEVWTAVDDAPYRKVLDVSAFEWVTAERPENGIEGSHLNPFYGGNNFDWAPGVDSHIEVADLTGWSD